MDRNLSSARKGNLSANGANFSNQQLLEALTATDHLVNGSGMHAIQFPEDYYFAERALIELGVLRPSRGMTAHKAFLQLMADIGYDFPVGQPDKNTLAIAVSYITEAPFPWAASCGTPTDLQYDDNVADLVRWRAIYSCIQKHLFGTENEGSAPKNMAEKSLGTEK